MSVFDNLIEELKREQLIEEGVCDSQPHALEEAEEIVEVSGKHQAGENFSPADESAGNFSVSPSVSADLLPDADSFSPAAVANENEFYRRRAMEEVSSLQLVEHIISGVEREQMKILPKTYDNIPVSKALHEFLQVSKNLNSRENAAAEFTLMQETESWHSALSHRDKRILSAQLRRYCETAKPVLSAQALAALARFYRNSAYSETVRSKFDMVVTRLFSVEENDERELAFSRGEIVQHLSELYADWASVSLYATDDDSQIVEMTQKFEAFINEAEAAQNFEKLVQSDFFNRLRAFKEQTGENFFAPSVAAAAITCNISVGNAYVRLLRKEQTQNNAGRLENKYSQLIDQAVSEAASKTLQLTALLDEKNSSQSENDQAESFNNLEIEFDDKDRSQEIVVEKSGFLSNILHVNKWLLGLAALVIVFNLGLYFWATATEPSVSKQGVEDFQADAYYFKDYLKSSKVVNESLICIVKPNWSGLSREKKQEILSNMLAVGKEKGIKTVRLQNNEGVTLDYLSDSPKESNTNQK